jgi:hypothetical protein
MQKELPVLCSQNNNGKIFYTLWQASSFCHNVSLKKLLPDGDYFNYFMKNTIFWLTFIIQLAHYKN